MNAYRDALDAMHLLLNRCGETHWRDWVAKDLADWDASGSVSHHLSAYGGMGSFNDVYLTAEACSLPAETESWLAALSDDLRSICYLLAQHQEKLLPGLRGSLIGMQMGAPKADVSGWRCRSCGYSEVTPREIELYLARREIRPAILEALRQRRVSTLVEEVLSGERARGVESRRDALKEELRASGISIEEREGWMRPCPRCGGDDTAVSYWEADGAGRFRAREAQPPRRV
jgi:hypothetical protein